MFRIATVGSLVLWAAIAWCTVALSLALHRAPVTISRAALAGILHAAAGQLGGSIAVERDDAALRLTYRA